MGVIWRGASRERDSRSCILSEEEKEQEKKRELKPHDHAKGKK